MAKKATRDDVVTGTADEPALVDEPSDDTTPNFPSEKKDDPEPAPAPVEAPVDVAPELPIVSAEIFARSKGLRFEQVAGFMSWASRKQIAYRTIPEWALLMDEFNGTSSG